MTAKKTREVEDTKTEIVESVEEKVVPEVEGVVDEKPDSEAVQENEPSAKEKVVKKAFVYLGPTLKGGLLNTGSVFQEIPEKIVELNEIFEKAPSVKKLFVEVSEAAKFKSDLKDQSSRAFRLQMKALDELKEV